MNSYELKKIEAFIFIQHLLLHTTTITRITMATIYDLPLDIQQTIFEMKEEMETRDLEGFATRFEIVKLITTKDINHHTKYNYVLRYKPTKRVVYGFYSVWRNAPFNITTALERIQESCQECEHGKCFGLYTYMNCVGYMDCVGVSMDELDFEEYVFYRNQRILMKKVLGESGYNIFVRIDSPFKNF